MSIIQSFYDNLASRYDKLFLDWNTTTCEQAVILDRMLKNNGYDESSCILDCACGIGTQTIGLAALGYAITASDISTGALAQARERAAEKNLQIHFVRADFCRLQETFHEQFDVIIAMDNALPHMLSAGDLESAVRSIVGRLAPDGMFVASIRDYDALLMTKPPYSPPYIHKTPEGQRVSFQTWHWEGENYRLVQYLIEDGDQLQTSKYECEYRATRRGELTDLLHACGCSEITWLFPEETGFYQPIVIAKK